MKTIKERTDKEQSRFLHRTFMKFTLLTISCSLICICSRLEAQNWKDQNRGLYPNAIQAIVNAKNHAIGLKFDHLFEKPLFNTVPIGVYASFSKTIKPNLWINNYRWENKYSIGVEVTLPEDADHPEVYSIVSIGLIWNQHPGMYQNEALPPGQYYAGLKETNPIGLDIGWRAQIHKWTLGFQIDAMNFFQYGQFSFGRCFSFYK